MTSHCHRYGFDQVRRNRLLAEEAKQWNEATYWMAQQLAIEHREEIQDQHKTHVYMDAVLTVIALASLVCTVLLLYR